jgi:hypothetical protein
VASSLEVGLAVLATHSKSVGGTKRVSATEFWGYPNGPGAMGLPKVTGPTNHAAAGVTLPRGTADNADYLPRSASAVGRRTKHVRVPSAEVLGGSSETL